MKNLFIKKLLITALVMSSLFLSSCGDFKEIEISDIKAFRIEKMNGNTIDMVVSTEILNPNSFGVTVVDADFDVTVQGINLGKTNINKNIKINRKSTELHDIYFTLELNKLSKAALPTLIGFVAMGKKEVNLKIDGSIKGKAFLISKRFPVHHEEKVPLKLK